MSQYPPPDGAYPGARHQPPVHLPNQQAAFHRLRQRIGDAERTAASDQLASHYSAGRITQEEFDERLTAIMTARNAGELWRQLSDLPALAQQAKTPLPLLKPSTPGISAGAALISVLAIAAGLGGIMFVAFMTFSSPFVLFSIGLAVAAATGLGYGLGVVQRLRRDRLALDELERRRRDD